MCIAEGKKDVCYLCERILHGHDYIMPEPRKPVCMNCASKIAEVQNCLKEFNTDSKNSAMNTDGFNTIQSQNDNALKPTEIKAKLDQYIVGQEHAKKVLSVGCYNHYKRNTLNDKAIKKSNILMVGPSGSGKTYLVETLAKIMNVPVALTVSTTLTEAGYIGDDVDSVVRRLLEAADWDVKKAEHGIIFIDEIDKLAGRTSETEKKVGGKGVQQALLPLLEGTIVSIGKANDEQKNQGFKVNIDTSGILFICGGAFPEAENIIKRRITKQTSMGFNAVVGKQDESTENILLQITTDDLREFGLIPEFLGRLPIIAPLESMSIDMLKKILVEPKDSILSQYTKLLRFDGVELYIDDSALEMIAEKAMKKGTGARALRSILEELLLEIQFSIPSKKNVDAVQITREYVEGNSEPYYHETPSNVAASY